MFKKLEKIGVHLDIIFYVPSPSSASIFYDLCKKDNFQYNKIVVYVSFFVCFYTCHKKCHFATEL
jgi:hypothetical protein